VNRESAPGKGAPHNKHSIGSETSEPDGRLALIERCTGGDCPMVLAGAADPALCDECREDFGRAGITTRDEQLQLVEVEPEERAA
jgi:hypothetical protein